MYPAGDTQWLMYPVGDGGGEEDLCHVCSVTHGDGRGEEDLCHIRSGGYSVADVPSGGWERRGGSLPCTQGMGRGHSVADVPSGGWGRRGGSLPCTQWGTLSDTCTQWGMGEERRISAMYAVGDTQWLMYPVGDGEERRISAMYAVGDVPSGGWGRRGGSLPCTQWGTLTDTCTQWGMGRRGGSLPCTQWGMLSDTCTQWGMGEERRISAMYAVGDAH